MDTIELKPCPFCGEPGENMGKSALGDDLAACWGKNENCGHRGIIMTVEQWSTRTFITASSKESGEVDSDLMKFIDVAIDEAYKQGSEIGCTVVSISLDRLEQMKADLAKCQAENRNLKTCLKVQLDAHDELLRNPTESVEALLDDVQILRLKEIVVPQCNRDPETTIGTTINYLHAQGWLNAAAIQDALAKGDK